jgi:hypothetical protein
MIMSIVFMVKTGIYPPANVFVSIFFLVAHTYFGFFSWNGRQAACNWLHRSQLVRSTYWTVLNLQLWCYQGNNVF